MIIYIINAYNFTLTVFENKCPISISAPHIQKLIIAGIFFAYCAQNTFDSFIMLIYDAHAVSFGKSLYFPRGHKSSAARNTESCQKKLLDTVQTSAVLLDPADSWSW